MSRRGIRVSVEISLSVNERVNRALAASIDGAELSGGSVRIMKEFGDIGDARAYVNSTLRVISASILTILGNER